MDFKRFKIRLKNRQVLLNFVLSSISVILFILIIFFTLTVFAKKYQDIVATFGIKIDDDCKLKQGLLSCGYIKLSGKDFYVNLEDIQGVINFKGLFSSNPVLDINIHKADVLYLNDLKAPPSERIPGIFETYLFLSYTKLSLGSLNLKVKDVEENTDLVVKANGIKNKRNLISVLNIEFVVIKEDKYIPIKALNPTHSLLAVNPSWLHLKNITLNHNNVYITLNEVDIHETRKVSLEGSSTIKNIIHEGMTAGVLNYDFKLNFKPQNFIELKSKGKVDQVVFLDEGGIKDITFNFDLNGKDISDFKLKGYIRGAETLFKGKKIGKVEFNYRATKKDDSLSVNGNIDTDITNVNLNLKDDLLNLKTDKVVFSKLKSFIDIPEWLKGFEGELSANIGIDISKWSVYADMDIQKAVYNQLKNLSGKVNLQYTKDVDTLNVVSSLSNSHTGFHLKGKILDLTAKPNFDLQLDLSNFNLENIDELKNLKIAGDTNVKGKIYGNLDGLKILLDGYAKTFKFEEISLKDINYKFRWEDNNININANLIDKTLSADVNIDLNKDQTFIGLKADKFVMDGVKDFLKKHSDIFSKVNVSTVSGKTDILIPKEGFNLTLKLDQAVVSVFGSSQLITTVDGFITDKDSFLKVHTYADKFILENHQFENLSLKATVKNKDISYNFSSFYSITKNKINLSSNGTYNVDTTNLKADIKADGKVAIKEKLEDIAVEGFFTGNIENLDGSGIIKLGKVKIPVSVKMLSSDTDKLVGLVNISSFSYLLDKKVVSVEGIQGQFDIDRHKFENIKGVVKVKNLLFSEKNINLVGLKDLTLNIFRDKISVVYAVMGGVLRGKVDTLEYNFKNGLIKVNANGEIDRKYLSEIFQLLNVDGDLRFSFSYSGDIKSILSNYNLRLYGDNLKLRTPYTQNIITFKKFNLSAKDQLYVDIDGFTKSSIGDGMLKISGKSKLDYSDLNLDISSVNIPVKYQHMFSGLLDGKGNIKLADKNLNIYVKSQITGRAKIEPDMFENTKTKNGLPELIKKAKLNVDISTSSPIFLEGSWGRAYAEGEIYVNGTVEKPILNGKIRVNYGKATLMRNIYNIDFLNIKITNNNVYVNGRLSTFVSGLNVFVNISGPANNLKYDFFSTPPKSKEEILTLLLLKKTPEQITSTGLFSILGKVGEMFIPFKVEEEDKGIFGTGVNINVIPSYSPVQGVVFSVYMQKYLTRRIYIGLSRPLSQYQLVNYVGWYEGGVKLTEKTHFVIKSFENKTRSAEITFTLPFDF